MPLPLEYVVPALIVLLALGVLALGWVWRRVFGVEDWPALED